MISVCQDALTMNVFIWALANISMKFEVWFSNEKTNSARQFQFYQTLKVDSYIAIKHSLLII